MEKYIEIISNVGFPIFIAVFLLIRIEPTLKRLERTLNKICFFLDHTTKEDYHQKSKH